MEIFLLILVYVLITPLALIGYSLTEGDLIQRIVGWLLILIAAGISITYYVFFPEYRANHRTLCIIMEVLCGLIMVLFIGEKGGKKDE